MIEMSRWLARLVVPLALCGWAPWAQAQAVYKCQSQGKTTYSREPCPGAVVVDTTPSRGFQSPPERPREDEPVVAPPGQARPALSREARMFQCKHLEAAAARHMEGAQTSTADLTKYLMHKAEELRKQHLALGCVGLQ